MQSASSVLTNTKAKTLLKRAVAHIDSLEVFPLGFDGQIQSLERRLTLRLGLVAWNRYCTTVYRVSRGCDFSLCPTVILRVQVFLVR